MITTRTAASFTTLLTFEAHARGDSRQSSRPARVESGDARNDRAERPPAAHSALVPGRRRSGEDLLEHLAPEVQEPAGAARGQLHAHGPREPGALRGDARRCGSGA